MVFMLIPHIKVVQVVTRKVDHCVWSLNGCEQAATQCPLHTLTSVTGAFFFFFLNKQHLKAVKLDVCISMLQASQCLIWLAQWDKKQAIEVEIRSFSCPLQVSFSWLSDSSLSDIFLIVVVVHKVPFNRNLIKDIQAVLRKVVLQAMMHSVIES